MVKEIKSISELGHDLGLDYDELEAHIKNHCLSRLLTVLRIKKGLNEAEMATLINMPQTFVSKLEHSSNNEITIDDIIKYITPLV